MNTTNKILELLKTNNHYKLEEFIKSGANLSEVNILDIVLNENSTHDTYKLLIENGIDINVQDEESGNTILMLASMNHDIDMVKFLVKHGANLDIQNNMGSTAITFPIVKGNYEIVEYFIQAGADVNIVDNNGFTSLLNSLCVHEEVLFDGVEEDSGIIQKTILETFLKNAPKFEVYNKIAKLLVLNGADVNCINNKDGEKYSPYLFALKSGNKEMMEFLVKHGAKTVGVYALNNEDNIKGK